MSDRPSPLSRALVFSLIASVALTGLLVSLVPAMFEIPAKLWCPAGTAEISYGESHSVSSRRGGVEVTIHCLAENGDVLKSMGGMRMFLSWIPVLFAVFFLPFFWFARREDRRGEEAHRRLRAKRQKKN